MAGIKKDSPKRLGKPRKKGVPTVWDHHDTMIVNLRMWVDRSIENIHKDVEKHAPGLVGKLKLEAAMTKAKQLNVAMWDQIRLVQEMADAHKEVQ
jgi:hypothetical protein